MMQKNPWEMSPEELAAVAGAPVPGPMTITSQRDPLALRREARADDAADRAAAASARAATAADRAASNDAYRIRMDAADPNRQLAQMKLDEARTTAALGAMGASSNVHGEEYLRKYVPAAQREMVRAYARGDLGSRAGGMSASMLPIIQHAMNYDPNVSATTFPARVKMHSDLAGSQPGTAGGALRGMERMLLHGREVMEAGAGLDNYGPGLLGTVGNAVRTGYERHTNDPRLSGYEERVRNYAPEAQKAIAQTTGGVGEREERAGAFGASLPQATRVAALQGDARQALDAMNSVNDQYRRLMGRDITDMLSPDAKKAYDAIMSGGYDKAGKPLHPAESWTPLAGPPNTNNSGGGNTPPSGGVPTTAMTKQTPLPGADAIVNTGVRAGTSIEQVNAQLVAKGFAPIGDDQIDTYSAAIEHHRKNPGYRGSYSNATRTEATTGAQRFNASSLGTGILTGVNAASGGIVNRVTGGMANQLETVHPDAAFVGNLAGAGLGAFGAEAGAAAGLAKLGLASARAAAWAPRLGDAIFGASSGANIEPNADAGTTLANTALGTVAGVGGGMFGRRVLAPVAARAFAPVARGANAALDRTNIGFRFTSPAAALEGGPAQALASVNRGVDPRGQLLEAAQLGVPMTLADTSASARALAGASIRRSPEAAQLAENALLPRSRGQVDRFGAAITRDLGPVANVPQQSEALVEQARAAAAPLYPAAYANPVPHTPELGAVLETPFGRQALGRARTIAANERRSPTELGFAQDAEGNTVLNPMPGRQIADHLGARAELDDAQAAYRAARVTPSADTNAAASRVEAARAQLRRTQSGLDAAPDPSQPASVPAYTQQTLDYVKRGMDDVLEQRRNPLTGRLVLDEAGRAENGVRSQLLSENDRLNPAFAQARAAYQGPVAARDALTRGQDALNLSPDELRMQVGRQSPEHMAQMQLGFRSQLMENGRAMRAAGNPFDAASTLGTPAAVDRLGILHPGSAGVLNLLRTAELERGLARTTNKLLGNSDTAERMLADKAFGGGAVPSMALDAGMMAMGGVPTATVGRAIANHGLRDAFTLGLGKRAVAKADAIAPIMVNPDPLANISLLDQLAAADLARRQYLGRASVRRASGMFGNGIAASALSAGQ